MSGRYYCKSCRRWHTGAPGRVFPAPQYRVRAKDFGGNQYKGGRETYNCPSCETEQGGAWEGMKAREQERAQRERAQIEALIAQAKGAGR